MRRIEITDYTSLETILTQLIQVSKSLKIRRKLIFPILNKNNNRYEDAINSLIALGWHVVY